MLRGGFALGTFVALGAFACTPSPVGATAVEPATAILPARAGAPWSASDITALRGDLDAMLANDPAVRGAHVGVSALATDSATPLYERNAGDEFQPASTLKLLVGSVALDKLGTAYRFTTRLERTPEGLVLRAGGDPLLATSDLDAAAHAVSAAGIGDARRLWVDASRYDTPPYPEGWVWDDFAYDYAVRVSAAALDENVVSYDVAPGLAAGAPVRIFEAGSPVVTASRCPGLIDRATTAPGSENASIDTLTLQPDCAAVVGRIGVNSNARVSIDVAVMDPVLHLRDKFRAKLQAAAPGLAPDDDDAAARNAPPSGVALWKHDSDPLATWLGPSFWIPSDNFVAEQLLCEVGYVVGGAPGSTERGLDAERAWLRANGIDPATTTLADGSGLSQYDRITPRDLVAILQHDWTGPNRELVLDSLPLGGVRGTIEGIAGTSAAGRVYAKTGSMSHVRGLAGYLATLRHGAVTFAFNVDDWNGDYVQLAALRAKVLARIIAG